MSLEAQKMLGLQASQQGFRSGSESTSRSVAFGTSSQWPCLLETDPLVSVPKESRLACKPCISSAPCPALRSPWIFLSTPLRCAEKQGFRQSRLSFRTDTYTSRLTNPTLWSGLAVGLRIFNLACAIPMPDFIGPLVLGTKNRA